MSSQTEIKVPDIGGATNVDVIEVLVVPGDTVAKDDSLITLESDKASMDIPSPYAGKITQVVLKAGGKVSQGDVIAHIEVADAGDKKQAAPAGESSQDKPAPKTTEQVEPVQVKSEQPELAQSKLEKTEQPAAGGQIYAGPAVRRMAREFDLDLTQFVGSGVKGRIQKEDVQNFIKQRLRVGAQGAVGLPPAPDIDFSQFGDIETKPLSKIKRLTGENVHRSWVTIPHVTQFDEADITELEAFRQANKQQAEKQGFKLTLLAFIMKAVVKALQTYPQFNTSLHSDGQQLIYKKYFHIGVAVETPNGLVVPVIRDVDRKGVFALAEELAHISQKAREKGLMPNEMAGSCFTISSLGGIGGTAFTPIVNAPNVAILGVSKAKTQPVWRDDQFVPRLIMPLSLSYDHRVIDGAEAARFAHYLADCLSDIRHLVL
jgi:pyruvate dehydrogenase E2 component (dihydrolipoyllysine-residue acetyltransferase)